MLEFFGDILTTIYDFFPNYAFAIIIFTCLVMIVLTPVTLKQTRSMLAMQKVAPELKKLRKKHGNDRDKLNQEMMALYQANGINPLAGCLPLIAQMPIFFGLFYTVRGLTRRTGDVGIRLGDVSIVDQTNTDYIPALNAQVFNPDFIGKDTEMYLLELGPFHCCLLYQLQLLIEYVSVMLLQVLRGQEDYIFLRPVLSPSGLEL